jgi:hypothetical protein
MELVMKPDSTAKEKRKDLDYLLQGIDLTAIDLDIQISKGSRNIQKLFWLICALLSIGMTCITFFYLHQYKYI